MKGARALWAKQSLTRSDESRSLLHKGDSVDPLRPISRKRAVCNFASVNRNIADTFSILRANSPLSFTFAHFLRTCLSKTANIKRKGTWCTQQKAQVSTHITYFNLYFLCIKVHELTTSYHLSILTGRWVILLSFFRYMTSLSRSAYLKFFSLSHSLCPFLCALCSFARPRRIPLNYSAY